MRGSEYAELRAFASIVEHGGFARAAAQLGVSPSALSQTIRGLEARLGVRLLNRTTRSVAPSEAGARLLARLEPAFKQLDGALFDLQKSRDQPSGTLRINTPRVAAVQFIGPLIGPFHRAYPDIVLDVVVQDSLADIVAGRFDAGIRLGERLEKDMVAVPLSGELTMMVVGTPGYFAARGTPRTPHELANHVCINFRMPTDLSVYRWEFERKRKKLEVAVDGPLVVNETQLALRGVLDGLGLAYLFDFHVAQLIATGRLVRVLEAWSPPFPGFYLYHPSRRHTPPALRAFIDFIRAAHRPTALKTRG